MYIQLAIVAAALFRTSIAAPVRSGVVKRDGGDHVVVYQEVLQVVVATSTVYVDAPAATSQPVIETSDIQSSEPKPTEASVNQPPQPSPTESSNVQAPQPSPTKEDAIAIPTAASHDSGSASVYSGKATYYDPGMGSCGIESNDTQDVVAISREIMHAKGGANPNANPLCGQKIRVTCESGKTVDATIVDTCPGCAGDDIDLSPSCFSKIADLAAGKIMVSWTLI